MPQAFDTVINTHHRRIVTKKTNEPIGPILQYYEPWSQDYKKYSRSLDAFKVDFFKGDQN